MAKKRSTKGTDKSKKVRVPFRQNRQDVARDHSWTRQWSEHGFDEVDTDAGESVRPKGGMSRKRTVIERADGQIGRDTDGLRDGCVVAMRGLIADVHDGEQVWPCTIRRVLRTRRITERRAVTVGDRVRFSCTGDAEGVEPEGVIEAVAPRQGVLQRAYGNKIHTLAANVDQALIVSAADQPAPKPHLIDRYLIAALAGEITPIIVINKMDLDQKGIGGEIVSRYAALGYPSLAVSALTGDGVDAIREQLAGRTSAVVGQSGVGKSALLNAVQPGLRLRTGEISDQVSKGRHTTTTAELLHLDAGGYVVDTPGIRTLELPPIELGELESYFVEFVDRVKACKYPNCAHVKEDACAIRAAVEAGEIHPERYDSYLRVLAEG
jgi:ribosome biogenesis GTPase